MTAFGRKTHFLFTEHFIARGRFGQTSRGIGHKLGGNRDDWGRGFQAFTPEERCCSSPPAPVHTHAWKEGWRIELDGAAILHLEGDPDWVKCWDDKSKKHYPL